MRWGIYKGGGEGCPAGESGGRTVDRGGDWVGRW